MLSIKKELKNKHSSLKDGPAMSKFVSNYIKENDGDAKKTTNEILKLSLSDIENKLEKINKEIAEKRASKKSA